MTDSSGKHEERVRSDFQEALDRHGYSFQHSVIKIADELYEHPQRRSAWRFVVSEFPVEVKEQGTRIDFILKHRSLSTYILAECKRANPAVSNWCFAQAPYLWANHKAKKIIVERAWLDETNHVHAHAKSWYVDQEVYHIALEVKSRQQVGDPKGHSPHAIEDAATQVSKGLNGVIQAFARNIPLFQDQHLIDFLPVIFTTANLWTTDGDLSSADVATGKIDLSNSSFTSVPWILYQYHLSPGLKHAYSPEDKPKALGGLMESEFARTIPIVSPSGIPEFLDWSGAQEFD
jgi:hypothetical protein